jgi:predicted regulator of Ras-like GTPase activity (Roadblock/LC7/MglB family)
VEGGSRLPTHNVDESKVDRLRDLLGNLPQLGISFYMVGTKEGLSVVSDTAANMPDPDLLSAATATMVSTGDFLSSKYKEGMTKEIVVHVEGGYILVFRVGSGFNFATVVGDVANLDYYLDILRKYSGAIEEVLTSGEEEVKEVEEILKKELEVIGVPAGGAERGEPRADVKSQTKLGSKATSLGKAMPPKRKKPSQ